jgi:hypothetical protein
MAVHRVGFRECGVDGFDQPFLMDDERAGRESTSRHAFLSGTRPVWADPERAIIRAIAMRPHG